MPTPNFSQKLKKLKSPERLSDLAEKTKSNLLRTIDTEGRWLEELTDLTALDLQTWVRDAHQQLDDTIDRSRSPLRVSLIGPFTSGKTVTLCALLGSPNLLPRAAQPTSGNVVEVQVVPPGSSDKINVMECTLFSPLELETMLRDYYNYLSQQRLILKTLPNTPGFLREQVHLLSQELKQLLSDQRREYKKGAANRISYDLLSNLAHLYFILVTINRYLSSYPQITNPYSLTLGLPYPPNDLAAQQRLEAVTMLDMQWGLDELEPAYLENKVDTFWQQLPANLEELTTRCQQGVISTESLRALLPLYKRILLTQEMKLTETDWKGIQRISFLDFPGVGSNQRRDTYLCLQELPQAHVNLLFFLANRPTTKEAQPLVEMVGEAKKHLTQLSDRLIPVINFFDSYDRLPAEISPDQAQIDTVNPEQLALQRVENFFAQTRVAGVEEGFDVFDKTIVGSLFPAGKEWEYYLLSPVVSLEPASLTDKEKNYRQAYYQQKDRYGQLLRDVDLAVRYLSKNRAAHSEAIKKYERLLFALEAYHEDGGIKRLREDLIKGLKQNGFRLIIEDAAPGLQRVLEHLETNLIAKLPEVDIDEDTVEEMLGDRKTRELVLELWTQMEQLTKAWLPRSDLVRLQHENPWAKDQKSPTTIKYISPLALCEAKVLEEVLADEFWQEWATRWLVPPAGAQPTVLANLTVTYRQLESRLEQWSQRTLDETIEQTLNQLDQESLPRSEDNSSLISFAELRHTLFTEYVNKAEVTAEEKKILTELFSLTSLRDDLRRALEQSKGSAGATPADQELNTKVPFNESLQFNWSPVEVMKIQRQLILTLQRRVASYFASYLSTFFQEFQRILQQRTFSLPPLSIDYHRTQFEQPGGLFDRLARIPQAEEVADQDNLTRRGRRQKAKEAVVKIRDAWEELLKQLG